jgi:lysozyme
MEDRVVQEEIKKDEGLSLKAYKDTKGIWTIGYGTNLQTLEITQDMADTLFLDAFNAAVEGAKSIPVYSHLSPVRQGVLVCMVYQMGLKGVLNFRNMLAALSEHDYYGAYKEMLDSKWARYDSPARARRMANRMLYDVWYFP